MSKAISFSYFGALDFSCCQDFALGPSNAYTLQFGRHVSAHDIHIILLDLMMLAYKVMQITFQIFGWWKSNADNTQDLPSLLDTISVKKRLLSACCLFIVSLTYTFHSLSLSLPSGIVVQLLANLNIDLVSHLPLCDTTAQNRLEVLNVGSVPGPRTIAHHRLNHLKTLECILVQILVQHDQRLVD